MGKKSLTKSTTGNKKNTAAQKKGTKKKSEDTKPEKNTKTKNAGAGKSGTKKSAPKKTAKKPALKTLRKKKFETWIPEDPYVPESGTDPDNAFTAPEITGDYEQKDAEKIRALLFKKIDLTTFEPEKPAPEAAEEKTEKPETPRESAKEESSEEEGAEKPEQDQPPGGGGTFGGGGGQPPQPPGPTGGGGIQLPISKGMLGAICAVAVIFVLIIGASIKNMDTYYLEEKRNSLEIYRGEFSPTGREKVAALPGVEASKPLKDKYSKQEALTLAFEYFMERADDVTGEQDLPDLNTIKENLEKAKKYAATDKQKERVNSRLNRIEFLMLIYRADVAAENQSEQGYETALEFLEKAGALELSEHDRQALKQRTDLIRQNLEKLQEESGNKGDSK